MARYIYKWISDNTEDEGGHFEIDSCSNNRYKENHSSAEREQFHQIFFFMIHKEKNMRSKREN